MMYVEAEFNGIATTYVTHTLNMVFKSRTMKLTVMPATRGHL